MVSKKMVMASGLVLVAVLFILFNYFGAPQLLSLNGIENCENVDRSAYGISPIVFAQLPILPDCFNSVVKKFHARTFTDDDFFSKDYFLQPEFYPNFLEQGLSFWNSPDETRYGVIGLGAFPAEQTVVMRPGQTKTIHFFLHSGFGVRSFQGLRLNTPFKTLSNGVSVSLDEDSQNGFLLGPSFPVFDEKWAKRVSLNISADENAPSHVIEVLVTSAPPSALDESAWAGENSLYYPATQYVGKQTVARIFIKIVD